VLSGCTSTQAPVSRTQAEQRPAQASLPTPTAFPTVTRDPILDFTPPAATIEVDGRFQTAGIGTYSWQIGNSGIHADGAGPVTPNQPLVVPHDLIVTLRLPLPERPIGVQMSSAQVTGVDAFEHPDGKYRT